MPTDRLGFQRFLWISFKSTKMRFLWTFIIILILTKSYFFTFLKQVYSSQTALGRNAVMFCILFVAMRGLEILGGN